MLAQALVMHVVDAGLVDIWINGVANCFWVVGGSGLRLRTPPLGQRQEIVHEVFLKGYLQTFPRCVDEWCIINVCGTGVMGESFGIFSRVDVPGRIVRWVGRWLLEDAARDA